MTTMQTTQATPDVHHEIIKRRNSNMRQATADQSLSLLETLADFRIVFPTIAEVTEIVVSNGGMKSSGKETQNTTLLLYIAMLGEDAFNGLYDSTTITKEDTLTKTAAELNQKCAKHALAVYRAMILVDKYAPYIPATAKFTRNADVRPMTK